MPLVSIIEKTSKSLLTPLAQQLFDIKSSLLKMFVFFKNCSKRFFTNRCYRHRQPGHQLLQCPIKMKPSIAHIKHKLSLSYLWSYCCSMGGDRGRGSAQQVNQVSSNITLVFIAGLQLTNLLNFLLVFIGQSSTAVNRFLSVHYQR